MASINASPIADGSEYLPPTQSQNPNMLSVSMPKPATRSAFVDTATKWLRTASAPSASISHRRAVSAFVSVSSVPKVLEHTTNSVPAGSRSARAWAMSAPSMFDTKRTSGPSATSRKAVYAITGPRCEPPIPTLTTVVTAAPVCPRHRPVRTASANCAMRSSVAWTSAMTSSPSIWMAASRGARRAVCPTARSSVVLRCSPARIAAKRPGTSARWPSATSRSTVSPVTRFLE